MSDEHAIVRKAVHSGADDVPEMELSDDDILHAMRHIPGQQDISTWGFRATTIKPTTMRRSACSAAYRQLA
jgi:hypothetical protein